MAAFRKAVALGATFIETDLQLSRDARFVAIHDATLNRTTNGQGAVHDMTLAELRKLDAGSWGGEHAPMGALRESREIPRAVVISFDASIVLSLRKIEPTLMTGLLYDGQVEKPIQKAVEIGARQLAVRGDLVSPALLAEARKKDLQVVCWTVNHPAHMRMLIAAGVDGIMSDYPDRLVAAVRKETESIS